MDFKEINKYREGYEMLLNKLGVSFQWHIGKKSKKLEYRDLTGPKKLCISKARLGIG